MSTGIYRSALAHAAQVAAKGAPCAIVDSVAALRDRPGLRCVVADQEHTDDLLAALQHHPDARALLLCSELPPPLLAAALRSSQVMGFLSDGYDGPRMWEVGYAVRRALSMGEPVPLEALFRWAHTQVTFGVRSAHDRDRVVDAVGTVGGRFGLARSMARHAMQATGYFVDQALAWGLEPDAPGGLRPDKGIRVQIVIDAEMFGVEVTEPTGRLQRNATFAALLRGASGATEDADSWGVSKLHDSAAMVRFYVDPGVQTRSTYLIGRTASRTDVASLFWEQRDPRHAPIGTPPGVSRH